MFYRWKELYFDSLCRFKRVCLLLFGGLLLISAALMLFGGLIIYRATMNWPQAKGRLLKFELRPLQKYSSNLKLELAFSYSVGDMNFRGQYLSPMTRPGKVLRWESRKGRLWYQLPGQKMDEFVRLAEGAADRADELIAYIGLMQQANLEA